MHEGVIVYHSLLEAEIVHWDDERQAARARANTVGQRDERAEKSMKYFGECTTRIVTLKGMRTALYQQFPGLKEHSTITRPIFTASF
ncbi:MAG: hypothetical protein ABH864_03920 [archaeon]